MLTQDKLKELLEYDPESGLFTRLVRRAGQAAGATAGWFERDGYTRIEICGRAYRECQRYAAGHVKPPAYFLRRLLRSEHGRQWLNAAMDGCKASWWEDLQGVLEISATHSIRRK